MPAWCQVCHLIQIESRDEGKSRPSLYSNMGSYIKFVVCGEGGGGRVPKWLGCGRERERGWAAGGVRVARKLLAVSISGTSKQKQIYP